MNTTFRKTQKKDVPFIVAMLADDEIAKKRPEALKFYESLRFKASHEGMKLHF